MPPVNDDRRTQRSTTQEEHALPAAAVERNDRSAGETDEAAPVACEEGPFTD
jgi:hypothetical protein